jgi:hypothetical protein
VAHEKAYFVFVAQIGSNVMLVHRANDRRLAEEVSSGQPDGTGFVWEVSRDTDPGVAGGMDRDARSEAEQLEGKQLRQDRREAAGTPMSEDMKRGLDTEGAAATARRAADLVEKSDKAVERAAAKTENRVTVPDSAKGQDSSSSGDQPNVLRPDPNAVPSVEDQAKAKKSAPAKDADVKATKK